MLGRLGEITAAVDPFDMTFVPFQAVAGLFLLYAWWAVETWQLTYLWWASFVVVTTGVLWPEIRGRGKRLSWQFHDALGKRNSRLPTDERCR